jgi:hypothetical protein
MSLAIDVNTVTHVLLADGWHTVAERSFLLRSYEYYWSGEEGVTVAELDEREGHRKHDPIVLPGGGQSGVTSTGFSFRDQESGSLVLGPLTSVVAVMAGNRTSS